MKEQTFLLLAQQVLAAVESSGGCIPVVRSR